MKPTIKSPEASDVILIVDDSTDNLMVMKMVLENALPALTVLTCQDPEKAISILQSREISLALIDIQMPQMDGFELCKRIKNEASTSFVSIILITGYLFDPKMKAHGLALGADDYITRPMDNEEFCARVKVALRNHQAETLQRHIADKALERFETIFRISDDMIAMLNTDYIYLMVNDAYVNAFGKAKTDIIGHSVLELFGKAFFETIIKPYAARCLSGENVHYSNWVDFPDTGRRFMDISYSPYIKESGKIEGFVVNARDLTDHKQTEAALAKNERRYKQAQRLGQVGNWEYNLNTETFWASDEAKRIYGFERESKEFTVDEVEKCIPERERVHQALIDLIEEGKPYNLEFEIHPKKGPQSRTIKSIAEIHRNDSGSSAKVTGVIQDITERKQAEELLRESESRFRYLFENAPLGYQSLNEDGEIIKLNETWCKILGYSKTEVLGKGFGDFVHPDSPSKFAENFPKFKQWGRVTDSIFEMTKKDGSKLTISIDGKIEHNPDGSFKQTHCMLRDISDQKNLEEQLRQAQKMESIGRLAGGVAHDFNNLLMGIMGYVELCKDKVGSNPGVIEDLDAITAAAERSAGITRQLLAFARKQIIQPKELDLNIAIEDMLKFLQRLLGEDIFIDWSPGIEAMTVMLDPSQLDQILANLAVNARDAIGGVGQLTIKTGNATIDPAYCATHADASPGTYVVLTVSDSGKGMDEETLEHLFEPFFTTKGIGQGTGLGLATVYGIVKQNKGFVHVCSEQGKGTTFQIYIPRHLIKSETPTVAVTPPALPSGSETILIAEDEKPIRMTCKFFLEALGYTVLAAEDPAEALGLITVHSGKIHLLLTDVVMPGMSGPDLAKQLIEKHPEMKCLYMSGFTADVIAQRGVLENNVHFLPKPFRREQLARKVREVLDVV